MTKMRRKEKKVKKVKFEEDGDAIRARARVQKLF